jgi:hypothetical protein
MDTDAFQGDGGSGPKDAGNSKLGNQPPVHDGIKDGSGLRVSSGLGDRGSGQGAGHKVATFLLHVQAQAPGEGGSAVPKAVVTKFAEVSGVAADSSGVYVPRFGQDHNQANADIREEDGHSQEGSMSTAELEKALGNLSQGESMSSGELKKAMGELGEEEEVSKEECLPVPDVKKLAAIPKASPEQSSARRSKRRARAADEVVATSAEHRKALRNEGTSTEHIHLSLVMILLLLQTWTT